MKLELPPKPTTPSVRKPTPSALPLDTRLTEQRNPRSSRIDELPTLAVVDLINAEDRMVAAAVSEQREQIARAIDLVVDCLRKGGRLIYVGAGTSGRLGVLDASEMPPTFGTEPELVQGIIAGGYEALVRSQEGAEDHPQDGAAAMDERGIGPNDFVLGIATSGTTPYVHGALARARELGARTGFLLCTYPSAQLIQSHDVVIAPLVGPEVITGSTRLKAGTATKLVLNTISTAAMVRTGKVYGNLMVDLQVTCQKLQDRGERILVDTLGVPSEEAARLLEAAGGHVKTAIVMSRLSLDAQAARQRLEDVAAPSPTSSATWADRQADTAPRCAWIDARRRGSSVPGISRLAMGSSPLSSLAIWLALDSMNASTSARHSDAAWPLAIASSWTRSRDHIRSSRPCSPASSEVIRFR